MKCLGKLLRPPSTPDVQTQKDEKVVKRILQKLYNLMPETIKAMTTGGDSGETTPISLQSG